MKIQKSSILLLMIVVLLTACGASKEVIDYGDATAFETALNNGENLEGKTVQIIVDDINPATVSGYDIYAGKHLNFVSSRHPDVKKGDTIVVRATTIESALGSWIIQYEKVENAVVGDTTVFSDSTITADSMVGTYVGKNGSVLILREDGTTAYYYMKSDEIEEDSDNTWSYGDEILTWVYNGTEVSGTVADDMSFTLKAQKEFDGWVREAFFKVSDDTMDKTVSEYRQLLRDTFNRAEMDNFDLEVCVPYSIGGVTFQIPFYWWDTQSGSLQFTSEVYGAEKCVAQITIDTYSEQITNEEFALGAEKICNSMLNQVTDGEASSIVKKPTIIHLNEYIGVIGVGTAKEDGYSFISTVVAINNPNADEVIFLLLIETDQTIFKYDADFEKIINSITPQSASENMTSESQETEEKSNKANGVTPELKEFLDSYEEFMDEYVAFMKKYQTATDTSSMLMDYLAFMQKYSDFSEKANAYDTNEMSTADAAYYLEVTSRVSQKLLQAAS